MRHTRDDCKRCVCTHMLINFSYARYGVLFYAVAVPQRKLTRYDAHMNLELGRDAFYTVWQSSPPVYS